MNKNNLSLGLSTMTKNQSTRLEEWIIYHNNLGHDKFIIFLDNCTDQSEYVLKNLISKKIDITFYDTKIFGDSVMKLDWISRSHFLYDFVIKNFNYLDFISFIEVDEFIFPQKKEIFFKKFLSEIQTNCLYINSWDFKPPFDETKKILGQSNKIWTDKQRFESNYRFRGKSVIRPKEFIKCIDAHHFMQKNNKISEEFKIPHINYIQINYGSEVTIDDSLYRIFHFRNHTDLDMNDYKEINYV